MIAALVRLSPGKRLSDEGARGRPLRNVRFSILFAALVSASCVVPVEIPHPDSDDGGVDAGTTEDAGSPVDAGSAVDAGFDAGVIPGPCSVPENLGLFLAKTTRRFVFPGCATASFSSEPGVSVVTRPNADGSATVEITPSTLGAWVLTLNANNSMQTRELLTDEQFDFDAGFVRRYPDRVDEARTVTPSGRLLVAGQNQFVVYGSDAGIEQTLSANDRLAVWTGNVLWTLRSPTTLVERWLDTPGGLVSTGTFDAAGTTTCFLCRVDETQVTSVIGTDLVHFTWDGGSFSKEVVTAGLQLGTSDTLQVLLPEPPDKVWGADMCSYEPGCTTTVCGAIQTCPLFGRRLVSATAQHALAYDGYNDAIQLLELPLSRGRLLHARTGFWMGTSPSIDEPSVVRTSLGPNNRFIISEAVIHRDHIVYRHFGDPRLIVTKRWVVRFISPRELQFIAR